MYSKCEQSYGICFGGDPLVGESVLSVSRNMRTQSAYTFIRKAAEAHTPSPTYNSRAPGNGYEWPMPARNINHDMLTYEVVPYGTTDVFERFFPGTLKSLPDLGFDVLGGSKELVKGMVGTFDVFVEDNPRLFQ